MREALRVDDHVLVCLEDYAHPGTRLVDYSEAQRMCTDGQLVCPACALFGAKGESTPVVTGGTDTGSTTPAQTKAARDIPSR